MSERYVFPFEKLEVWQESLLLADEVFKVIDRIPQSRHLRLLSQLEGAVASISQNIAEGKGRQHRKEFLQYLSIAQGSLYETVTLIELFRRRKAIAAEESVAVRKQAELLDRKLNGLMNAIRGKGRHGG